MPFGTTSGSRDPPTAPATVTSALILAAAGLPVVIIASIRSGAPLL